MKSKILIILLIMGLCYYDIALIFSLKKVYPEKMEISFLCEIVKEKEEKEYYNKYIVKVIENSNLKKSKNTKLILYVKKDIEFFPGNILNVKGNFEKGETSRNYKGFNYRKYLMQNKIYGIVFAEELELVSKRKDIYYTFGKIRNILKDKIDKLYEKDYSDFLKGLLIGDKSDLDESVIEDFQDANISHILAISGLHISFILVGMNFILEIIISSKKIRNWLLILFLIFFLNLTGNSVSCMRACIMNILAILCSCFYKKNNFYLSFSFSFIFIIILNPYNIFSVGMWLSFSGTLGIVVNYDLLYKSLCRIFKLKKKNEDYNFENVKIKDCLQIIIINIKKFVLKSFVLSVSSQIFIIPIIIYVFNNVSLTFFISNIIVSVFIGYILATGYMSIFISFILFPFSKYISYIEKAMIYIIFKTANIVGKLPFSKIYLTTPSIMTIIVYYVILFLFIIYFQNNKFHMLRAIKKVNISINRKSNIFDIKNIIRKLKKNIILKNIFVIIIIITIITNININKINYNLQIFFVDVGQGDCTFIITSSGKRILIDGGEGNSDKYDYGKKVLFPYLLDRGTNKIDYLIVSHADSDHIGGLIYILENMRVEKILLGIQPESSKQLEKLIEIANKKKIKIKTLVKEDVFFIDKNTQLDVLWPDSNNIISENTLNNNSLVFKLKYNNFSMLFTGDIEEIAEKSILETYAENLQKLKSTIIKVAHHGSKSSSTMFFIENVSPEIALIGVGKNNNFGHPNDDVINRLKKNGIKIYRTDKMGEISIIVNKKGKISVKKFIEEM